MKYKNQAFILLLIPTYFYAEIGHQANGTQYGNQEVHAYAQFRHGIDGSLFLDPYFLPFIQNVENLKIVDAGCGAAPWAIVAAKNGAIVYALDIQESMIACAKKAALENSVTDRINFQVGSVEKLPYANDLFDRALSINVGCNLPSDVFTAHFQELFRTLKSGGQAIITAPNSFGIVFTHGKSSHEANKEIAEVLSTVEPLPDQQILKKLGQLSAVLRATFVKRNGNIVLVTDEKMLIEGESIWRKIPGLVVPNFYHDEKQYIQEMLNAGFTIDRIDRPQFKDSSEWQISNTGLAAEYSYYPPFTIFHISKP